ncbi:V-type ATPase 116kDa subunit family protein [uncultured Sphaerochaeta sp.]|uniref:V-type ATP synthase subunit I n=1 Tax=uncultured Sphaerochaeta sp. TaxID=886478 RepID=UPI002A0A468A|nr:V-type ATPase 116kDa subunit family protein [uncultured Sphaerochaeta sp.]
MNLFTRPMKLLTAVVLEQMSDEVIKALLELGVMDFVSIKKIDPRQMERLSSKPSSISKAVLEDMRHRVEAVLRQGHCLLPSSDMLDVKNLEKPDIDLYRNKLDALGKQLIVLKDEQKNVNQQLLGLQELKRYIEEDKLEYLDLRVGVVGHGKIEDLAEKLISVGGILHKSSEGDTCIILALHRDVAQISPLLDKFGWTETSSSELQRNALIDISSRIDKEYLEVSGQLKQVEEKVDEIIKQQQSPLDAMWCNLRLNELCNQIRSYFAYTRNTTLFSGWVPTDQSDSVTEAISRASNGQCVIEWTGAEEMPREEIPVSIATPKAFSPFKKMVDNYNTPEYGSVNPTLFVMIAYLVMFALMFADVGQGFILLLIGFLGRIDYKRNPMKPDSMISRNLCDLLLYLGVASMIGGVLFGSYFGFSLFPAIWFNYDHVVNGVATGGVINDVYAILGLTVKFGIVIIYLGLVINWVNLFRKKDWLKLILDKNGLVGGWLFAIGLYLGYGYVAAEYRSFPSAPWITPALAIPLFLLLLPGFIEYHQAVKKGGKKRPIMSLITETVFEWMLNILEIFIGYLSNTLSFMRVAGLGIAHVSLMSAFKELSVSAGGGFWGLVIFLFGNVLVIALEGLSSGIQALRLNYYEFFSKYFTGKGIAYEPVGLRSPFSVNK